MSAGERITRTRQFAVITAAFTALPDAFRAEFITALTEFAPRLLARERAGVPVRNGPRPAKFAASRPGLRPAGGLVSLLAAEVDTADLSLRTGLLTKDARQNGFYGYILDAGRGRLGPRSKPMARQLAGKVAGRFGVIHQQSVPYSRAISPIPADRYDITFGRVRQWAHDEAGPMLARIADRALLAIGWNSLWS